MKPRKRQSEILAILRAMQKELRVEELSEMLEVSPLTVRRDLQQLSDHRSIIRTHGGCLAAGRAALETDYHKKVAQHFELKRAIGIAAAGQVQPGDILLLNDGSTTYHLASNLEDKHPLTVYTNSLAMISELSRFDDIKIYIIGGQYISSLYSLRGSLTEQVLESLSIDTVFLGCDAVDDQGRCLAGGPEEASLAKAMLRSGRRRILLCDHTKLNARGYIAYGVLQDFDLWITTPGMDTAKRDNFRNYVEILEAVV
jgi:DeoR/GlpR family transcriptional regulator of sugar metabolism